MYSNIYIKQFSDFSSKHLLTPSTYFFYLIFIQLIKHGYRVLYSCKPINSYSGFLLTTNTSLPNNFRKINKLYYYTYNDK